MPTEIHQANCPCARCQSPHCSFGDAAGTASWRALRTLLAAACLLLVLAILLTKGIAS